MKNIKVISGIAAALVVSGLLALPVKQVCPHGPCSSAPDAQGNIHRYYETKPLGVTLIEDIIGSPLPIHYSSGQDLAPAG